MAQGRGGKKLEEPVGLWHANAPRLLLRCTAKYIFPSFSFRFVAVPFVGKDVPSRASEYSHPDVVIGVTTLAFRYEGLRPADFRRLLRAMHGGMGHESGPYAKRPSCLEFRTWVELAGGRVRGYRTTILKDPPPQNKSHEDFDDIWPLELVDMKDEAMVDTLYLLLHSLPHAVEKYLNGHIFPDTMEFQKRKLSASGQDLGGTMLFPRRLGFSGTPSNLLPVEFGDCVYEKGDDAKMIDYLTSPSMMRYVRIQPGWTVRGVLDSIASADPPYHALIDTGALITGLTNRQVAEYLLTDGRMPSMQGVVFLDNYDEKMILVRDGMKVMKLSQCGIRMDERFSFYDQVHTTGMDIKQPLNARACLTIGKDMTFRDYAQGAFRMRGIGKGQTIDVFVIPEVDRLISSQLALAAPSVSSASDEQKLKDVTAWLHINGCRSENLQYGLLCEQSLHNIYRKVAYRSLLEAVDKMGKVDTPPYLRLCIESFRERVDYDIANQLVQPPSPSSTHTAPLHH